MTTQYIKNATAEDYQYNQDMYILLPAHALAPSMKHAAGERQQPYRQIAQTPQTCDAKLTSRRQKVADKFDYDRIHDIIRLEVKKRTGV